MGNKKLWKLEKDNMDNLFWKLEKNKY